MTPDHPVTPPPELVEQWNEEWLRAKVKHDNLGTYIATQAARWGSDQELEACCLWMERNFDDWDNRFSDELRTARRPKPPSLKEQALKALKQIRFYVPGESANADTIRRALEQLDD
jgi:hypothetical protein